MSGARDEDGLDPTPPDGPLPTDEPWTSLRPLGWASLVTAVLWIGGFGSLLAVGFGLVGVMGRDNVRTEHRPPPGLRMCQVGLVLGAVGMFVSVVLLLDP